MRRNLKGRRWSLITMACKRLDINVTTLCRQSELKPDRLTAKFFAESDPIHRFWAKKSEQSLFNRSAKLLIDVEKMKQGPFFCGDAFVESGHECRRQSLFSCRSARSISGNSPQGECPYAGRRAGCGLARADNHHVVNVRCCTVSKRLPARDNSFMVDTSHKAAMSRTNPVAVWWNVW